jgi:hypothetical protein
VSRTGGFAFSRGHGHTRDQILQPLQRVFPVLFQTPVLLGLDDEHSFPGNARIPQAQEPFLAGAGERRGADVEAQVHRRGDLVDVLASRSLRANRDDFEVAVGDRDRGEDLRHGELNSLHFWSGVSRHVGILDRPASRINSALALFFCNMPAAPSTAT